MLVLAPANIVLQNQRTARGAWLFAPEIAGLAVSVYATYAGGSGDGAAATVISTGRALVMCLDYGLEAFFAVHVHLASSCFGYEEEGVPVLEAERIRARDRAGSSWPLDYAALAGHAGAVALLQTEKMR